MFYVKWYWIKPLIDPKSKYAFICDINGGVAGKLWFPAQIIRTFTIFVLTHPNTSVFSTFLTCV
jgi:hypothetical protein